MNTTWLKRVVPRFLGMIILIVAITLPIIIGIAQVHADAVDLYWYPVAGSGTGDWNGGGHWATASDGTGLGHADPTSTNNVYFTATSFTGAGQVVTINSAANCKDMIWTGATNNPTLSFLGNTLDYYGNVTFISISTMSITSNAGAGRFAITGGGNHTLTSNGVIIAPRIVYDGVAGTLVLADDLVCSNTSTAAWSPVGITTNNHNITVSGDITKTAADVVAWDLGSSTVSCVNWTYSGSNLTLTTTGTIKCTGNFTGGNLGYNNVELNGATSTITGSNTFAKLSFKPAAGQTITFTDTTTQTAASFERTGTGTIVFQGSGVGGWALTDSNGGTNTFNALTVSRSTASGGTFNATTSSLDSGNNAGWTFPTTIVTSAVTGILTNSATGNATITNQGGSAITERGFCWNTIGTPTTASPKVVVAGTLGVYSGAITGLLPTTTYHVRSYLVNGSGTTYGNEQDFVANFTLPSSNLGYIDRKSVV